MPDPKQPELEIIDSEPEDENPRDQVVVDLEKKPVPSSPEKDKGLVDQTKQSQPDLSKLHNTIAYQNRKLDQAMRELQELKVQLVSRQEQTVPKETAKDLDEIDEIAQRDWKLGVKKVVEQDIESKIQEILQKRDQAVLESQRRMSLESELDNSKQKVLRKYPSIEDDTSEESSIYRQVLNEDQSLLSNVHGPEIAMYRMEDRMRSMGKTPPSVQPIVDREVNRLVRAGVSSVVGRTASPTGKITLTKDQKEFCDHYKIPYEQYAKNLKAQEAIGGVEV